MAYIKIETSVPRHHKFLAAGPEACWLWVAGTCYCMDGLTDGLIPRSALHHLGVLKPDKLALRLVAAGLWEEHPDGWLVHDFLDHNRPADYIRTIKQERRDAGARGGAASWDARAKSKQSAEADGQHTVSKLPNLAVAVAVTEAVAVAVEQKKERKKIAPPSATAEPPADAVLTFITTGRPAVWYLTQAQFDDWAAVYPGLDVRGECRKASAWLVANGRKTASGMPRFLVSWLNRAADGNGRMSGPAQSSKADAWDAKFAGLREVKP